MLIVSGVVVLSRTETETEVVQSVVDTIAGEREGILRGREREDVREGVSDQGGFVLQREREGLREGEECCCDFGVVRVDDVIED